MQASGTYGSGRARLADLLENLERQECGEPMILDAAENSKFEAMSLGRFPQSAWTGIDWERSEVHEQFFTGGEPEAAELVSGWLSRAPLTGSLVVVFWGNARVPSVAMAAECAAMSAEEILYTSDDVWMFVVDEGLLIEYMHDGRLTMGQVPRDS